MRYTFNFENINGDETKETAVFATDEEAYTEARKRCVTLNRVFGGNWAFKVRDEANNTIRYMTKENLKAMQKCDGKHKGLNEIFACKYCTLLLDVMEQE